jgi:hypothetical protein
VGSACSDRSSTPPATALQIVPLHTVDNGSRIDNEFILMTS